MYFLRRQQQQQENHHPHHPQLLLHPALAHILAQEEIMKCQPPFAASSPVKAIKQHQTVHCGGAARASPVINRERMHSHIHMLEESDHFLMTTDLPGVKSEDLSVEITDNGDVHIHGVRTRGGGGIDGEKYPVSFDRKFKIDEKSIDPSTLTATLADGVLEIFAPKKSPTESRRVGVISGGIPTLGVEETKTQPYLKFEVEVPGIKIDALQVEIDDDQLSIQGERTRLGDSSTSRSFNRSFTLNTKRMDTNQLEVFLEDGVLTVRVPIKVSTVATHAVPVNSNRMQTIKTRNNNVEKEMDTTYNVADDQGIQVDANDEDFLDTRSDVEEGSEDPEKEEASATTPSTSSEIEDFEVVPETVTEDDDNE